MNDDYKESDTSIWKEVQPNNDRIYINFKNNRRKNNIKILIRLLIFIMIAFTSGIFSAKYMFKKQYLNLKQNINANKPVNNVNLDSEVTKQNTITSVAQYVGPAVVAINNKSFGIFGDMDNSLGSGIIFKENGYIITNYHVIEKADKIIVRLSSGQQLTAKVIGTDIRSDLAVIKIEGENFPTAKLGDSSKVKIGDLAIAIGNPLGEEFAGTVTAGIVSATNRKIQLNESVYKVIQTDAAINYGNSGGALCNESGEVIGINSLKVSNYYDSSGIEGMGFAISINEAKDVINQILKKGYVSRPYIGIYGQTYESDVNNIKGAYVNKIVPNSGAAKAGIRPGDIIISFDGKKIEDFDDISDVLDKHKIGDTVDCKVYRNNKTINLKVKLMEIK